MGAARQEFFATLRSMLMLTKHPLLTDTFPPSATNNIGARVLRHGLSVSAFAMLEKHAESCLSELMSKIGASRIKYPSFTDKLKRFLTIDAVIGLSNRIQFFDATDRQGYADHQIRLLSSYTSTPAVYTALGFSPKGSNVSHKDIATAFGACGVEAPWEKLSAIATALGSSRLSLSSDFQNLAKTRHRSAHNPMGNVASADLETNVETAILIGIAIDVLASALSRAFLRESTPARLAAAISGITHEYRFIDQQPDGTWLERVNGTSVQRYADESAATAGALARQKRRIVIARDIRQVPLALLG
jgi:hypothetical protein